MHGQGGIRTKRRKHAGGQAACFQCGMMDKIVSWIVGRAQRLNTERFENPVGRQPRGGEHLLRCGPDRICIPLVEQVGDAEITSQFKVRPVIQGIAQGMGHR